MAKLNKAHTATARRIAKRYDGYVNPMGKPDITADGLTIEVETHATLHRGVRQLKTYAGPAYLAVTNMEALAEALRLVQETSIGVMDPQGNIVRQASQPSADGTESQPSDGSQPQPSADGSEPQPSADGSEP